MSPNAAGFELSDQEFAALSKIAARSAGLSIPATKKSLVHSRVARRLRVLNMTTPAEYLAFVSNDQSEERELISVLTTNVSSFYREAHHFDFLRETIIPQLKRHLAEDRPARLWSAGCSSGQEPYSIAVELMKAMPNCLSKDILILGTDIDPAILHRARLGEYDAKELDPLTAKDKADFFEPVPGSDDTWRAKEELKQLIRFRELNLHDIWPMKHCFDAVFCRNVVIYFDDEHQRGLWPRFRNQIHKGGWLLLGHSERIQNAEAGGFKPIGVTTYQKT